MDGGTSHRPTIGVQARAFIVIKANGGEAIKQGWEYVAGGRHACEKIMIEIMARKGLVRIETIGGSTFAVPA